MKLKALHKQICLSIGMLLVTAAVCHATVSRRDLEQVEKQVRLQTQEQKKLEQAAAQANQELIKVNKEMIGAARMIQDSEDSISNMENRLTQLEEDYQNAQNRLRGQDHHLVKMISALQSLALKPTEALFVQPLSPVDIVRSAMLLRETVPYLEAQAELIKKELIELENKREIIRRQVKRIVEQKGLLEREHAQMKVLAEKKAQYRAQVFKQSAQAKKNVAKLAEQAQDLRDLLARLEKEKAAKAQQAEARRQAEEAKRQAASSEKTKQGKTANLIKSFPETINETGVAFIKAKGSLSRPARGQIVSRYGQETSSGVTSKGITFQTRDNAQVIAPFDGSVLFAGPFRGYGNLIIIEHGKGYTSLLAGLNNIDCEVGQMLLAGEPVGQMPGDGSARLYMELRKDNHPIDPEAWMEK